MVVTWLKRTSLLVLMLLFAGCGGGGSSTPPADTTSAVVSGVAAAGAPIIGFAYLKDGSGTTLGPQAIEADGSFSFDTVGLVPPFLLQAQGSAGGQSYTLHSVATGVGTANINPLTNLIVAQASGGMDPNTVFANADLSNINQQSVDTAIASIQTALAPLLKAANVVDDSTLQDFDPIKVAYTADPTTNPLDALFDAVSVTVSSTNTDGSGATVTVADKSGNEILSSTATTTDLSAATSDDTVITSVVTTATDAQQIVAFLQSWGDAINAKGTALAPEDLDSFYVADPDFGLQNGLDRSAAIATLTNDLAQRIIPDLGQITSISNFALARDVSADYNSSKFQKAYLIRADFRFASGNYGNPGNLTVAQDANGAWKLIGNKFMIDLAIHPYANKNTLINGTVEYKTGLDVDLDDVGNQGVNSATLEGPGLPAGGITFSKAATNDNSATRLAIATQGTNLGDSWGQYEMTDAQIDAFDPSTPDAYTLKLYSGAAVPTDRTTGLMQTLHPVIAAAPVASADLEDEMFPTFDLPTLTHQISTLADMSGTTRTLGYTLQTAFTPAWAETDIFAWGSNGSSVEFEQTLKVNTTSASVAIPATSTTDPPVYGSVGIYVDDPLHRGFNTFWQLSSNAPAPATGFTATMLDTYPTFYFSNPGDPDETTTVGTTQTTVVITSGSGGVYQATVTDDYFDASGILDSSKSQTNTATLTLNADGTVTASDGATFTLIDATATYLTVSGTDSYGTWTDNWDFAPPAGWITTSSMAFTATMLDAHPIYYFTYPGDPDNTTNAGTTQTTVAISGSGGVYQASVTDTYFDDNGNQVSTATNNATLTLNAGGTVTASDGTTFTLIDSTASYLTVSGTDSSGTWSENWYFSPPAGWISTP